MIDFNKELVAALETILPTHYELFLHSGLSVPCYSYQEGNNYSTEEGDTLGYSKINYTVKVWADDIATINRYAQEADKVLRPLGFRRTSSTTLGTDTRIQKIMNYEATGFENY